MSGEISLSFYVNTVKKYWQFIAVVVVIAATVTGVKVIMTPRTYTSFVTVLVPSAGPAGSSASSIGRFLGMPNLTMGTSSKEIIGEILKSRTMSEDIVTHFKIAKTPNSPAWDSAVKRMRRRINVPPAHGRPILEIFVTDLDPKKAADIANFCATNLDKINEELHITTEKPMVKIIDKAIPPDIADSRELKKKVLVSVMFSGIMSILILLTLEYMIMLRVRNKE